MPFEALSERWQVTLPDFPAEWLPLTYLYDPDLPLFPIAYLHALDPDLPKGQRPTFKDRVFGYIRHVNLEAKGAVVGLVINKNLRLPANKKYIPVIEGLVRDRLGINDPIRLDDLAGGLKNSLAGSNDVLLELWHQIVAAGFGNLLPFGRLWDQVFGLIRFIASWNSDGGRKGELIQTHYFTSSFGVRIACGSDLNVDFYLLPTIEELQNVSNPLTIFPRFSELTQAATRFVKDYCDERDISGQRFSSFNRATALSGAKLDSKSIRSFIAGHPEPARSALSENYNAFNRGPQRSIISLMMIHDLRHRTWEPNGLTPSICAQMYTDLSSSFQTPKVIQLYAQQCFGAHTVLPIDNWVGTFLRCPLGHAMTKSKLSYQTLFDASDVWGKIERLIWVASQARKVHSSVASEILWCIRYGGPDKQLRGANPISCKICQGSIRSVCPAFSLIEDKPVVFNVGSPLGGFCITTSAGDDTTPNQSLEMVIGADIYDEYSARDRPGKLRPYPQPHGATGPLRVRDFIPIY